MCLLKFWYLFNKLEELIIVKNLIILNNNDENPTIQTSIRFLYNEILLILIEEENPAVLNDILNGLNDKKNDENYFHIHQELKENSQVLLSACGKDKFDLVKILVFHGFRLTTSYLENFKKVKKLSWYKYIIPNIRLVPDSSRKNVAKSLLMQGDEVNDLYLLKLMAKPSYVLGTNHLPTSWLALGRYLLRNKHSFFIRLCLNGTFSLRNCSINITTQMRSVRNTNLLF